MHRALGFRAGIFDNKTRLHARLAFWGERRAIPAAKGPETESGQSKACVVCWAPRQYYSPVNLAQKSCVAAQNLSVAFICWGDPPVKTS